MGQSKVSYHLGKLKEAGLVREETTKELLGDAAEQVLAGTRGCC